MSRWIVLGVIVGVISGLGAAGFFFLLELSKEFTFGRLAGYYMATPTGEKLFPAPQDMVFRRWVFFILPAVGGLISGLIVYRFAPEAEGHGTDAMIDAFHNNEGSIRGRVPFVKAVATIFTLATGGSAGREGPIAQIGGGIGSWIAKALKLPAQDRRILLLAGTGGGLGAIFRAPLGGAITAIEVIYKEDLETDALIPTVISSITAYTIYSLIFKHVFDFSPIFEISKSITFNDPRELIFYVILGLVCVPVGVVYIRVFYGLRDKVFRPMPIPNYLKPMIGGLMVGVIGLYVPEIYSGGWGQLQLAINGQLALKLMLMIVVFKILATSLTISSGGSGGVFGPTLMIGGMLGGAIGVISMKYSGGIIDHVDARAFVLVGMAAFFAGVANAPLGALLMVTEMTAGYRLVAPLLMVSMIAMIFTRRYSIYEKQVKNKFSSPAHAGEFTINVLEEMRVKDVYKPKEGIFTIPASARFAEVQRCLANEEIEVWPVVREDGTIVGVLSLDTTKPILFEDGMDQILNAADLAIPAAHVHPTDSLYQALIEFLKYPISEILVVDNDDENEILGALAHRDLIRAYNKEIIARKGK